MRQALIIVWILVPLLAAAYHYGPGQNHIKMDKAQAFLSQAERDLKEEQYGSAIISFDEAIKLIPAEKKSELRRVRLAKAQAQMKNDLLSEANADLDVLVDELTADSKGDGKLLSEARRALAQSQYYMTWLMRLEGQPKEVWEPEIETARQTYRLLVGEAELSGDAASGKQAREDLESSIRMARMDLSELQGLDLPKECKNCCSKCKGKKPGKKNGKKPGEKQPEDTRKAGAGQPPDDSGS